MPQIPMECPHCRTEKVGFAPKGYAPLKPGGPPTTLIFLQCEVCGHGVIAVTGLSFNAVEQWINGQVALLGAIQEVYPKPAAPKAPPDIPDNVRAAFLSGLDNLGRPNGANAAAIMLRRSIELAVKRINPKAAAGDNLKKRINDLPSDIATPAMKEWAHTVRLDANDAAHDPDEFSEEDAKELHIFAEMFLTYAFTLPAMLVRAHPVAVIPPTTQ